MTQELGYIATNMVYGMKLTDRGESQTMSAIEGILPNGDMKIEALVGRSLKHIKVTEGELEVKGLLIHYWRHESTKVECSKPPVVALHGGPSSTHRSQLALQLLADEGHPVIFYDQGGCGQSKSGPAAKGVKDPKNDAPWLLTIEYYVQELLALANHLSLPDTGYYLYGSSWGTVLAQEYAVTQPPHLLGMILDGALCDG